MILTSRHLAIPPSIQVSPPGNGTHSASFACAISLVLFGLLVATIIYGLGKLVFPLTQVSHSRIFQNQTLEEVKSRATVVRPLVDDKQLFDIAMSVWALRDEESGSDEVSKTPLYSNIVFRGLRLADKHKTASIVYRLPIAIFQRLSLKENDLRASVVLIPTSPSLLEHVTSFSTWRPESLVIPPVRLWPFPLGAADSGPQRLTDTALDSFAISFPLLEFHEIGREEDVILKENADDEDDDDEEEVQDRVEEKFHTYEGPRGISDIPRYPEHALKRHPFVVTRTQIRVVDETHIFSRKLYNREHNKLRSTSCGQGSYRWQNVTMTRVPDLTLCHTSYSTNGNWETRLELQVPDESTGEPLTEWAYAPHIGHSASSAGPKDLVAVPVTREICTQFGNTPSTDPDFVEINWQLSYSGRTPLKFFSADSFVPANRVLHNESDYKKAIEHDNAELMNGLAGHRFSEDAHPRRRFIMSAFIYLFTGIPYLLDMSYWYTRTSTVAISVSDTVLLALSDILETLTVAANAAEESKLDSEFSSSQWLPLLYIWIVMIMMISAIGFPRPFFMLKTTTRLAFSRDKSRWVPSVRRVSTKHMKRASQRLDSRTSWGIKAGLCVSLIAIDYITRNYYSFSPFDHHVLAPLHPPLGPTDRIQHFNPFARVFAWVYLPLKFTGKLSQIFLDQRTRTYAGSYKISVALHCISGVLLLMTYLPSVVGRYDARPGLSVADAMDLTMLVVLTWQAASFPKVMQKMEDEDSE
ncbi:hypothetical protein DFH08DRAFT_940114 [Mycena albidolilacea]|uniref:Uncharacterized protein n=1 Tax=Mycena albidolilacea TaxID=1033008 RepID=A0AAD6ZP90_9AGAR|nr:hypothetical protein DFH08DRAFT_940114 [Mycena albidolilacea]